MNPDGYKGYRFLAIRGNIVTELFKDSVERKDEIFVRKINKISMVSRHDTKTRINSTDLSDFP